jgi:hypothetical protein
MSDPFVKTINVQYSDSARQWCAHFDGAPHVTFGSDTPTGAARRLLDGCESPAGEYQLFVDQDQVGSGVLLRVATWRPPDLLFPCEACRGTGQYVGFNVVEVCKVCRGRKVLVG